MTNLSFWTHTCQHGNQICCILSLSFVTHERGTIAVWNGQTICKKKKLLLWVLPNALVGNKVRAWIYFLPDTFVCAPFFLLWVLKSQFLSGIVFLSLPFSVFCDEAANKIGLTRELSGITTPAVQLIISTGYVSKNKHVVKIMLELSQLSVFDPVIHTNFAVFPLLMFAFLPAFSPDSFIFLTVMEWQTIMNVMADSWMPKTDIVMGFVCQNNFAGSSNGVQRELLISETNLQERLIPSEINITRIKR